MKVRYNPVVGIVALVLGEFGPAVIAGLMPMLLGILYLARPYFWVTPRSVSVGALIGPMSREFMFQRLEADGARKKLPVSRWLAHPADWRAITGGR